MLGLLHLKHFQLVVNYFVGCSRLYYPFKWVCRLLVMLLTRFAALRAVFNFVEN